MFKQIKKTLAVLLAVSFLITVTAGAVSACADDEPYHLHKDVKDVPKPVHKPVHKDIPKPPVHKPIHKDVPKPPVQKNTPKPVPHPVP